MEPSCPGYPACGCDGHGRVAGGVGAVLPWFPLKVYKPCPAYVAAGKIYSRKGQSNEEIFWSGASPGAPPPPPPAPKPQESAVGTKKDPFDF
eukprot:PRCOL_00001131-RA